MPRSQLWDPASFHKLWLLSQSKDHHRTRLSGPTEHLARDPTKHSTLKEEIEEQSTALYGSARLWDDGIIKPTDTRDTVGLALALAARKRVAHGDGGLGESTTTWDGNRTGFGVFRM